MAATWTNATATGQPQGQTTTFGPDSQVGTSTTQGTTNQASAGNQSGWESGNQTTTTLDPNSMKTLQEFIAQLMSGGTANQKGEIQKRDAMTQFVTNLLGLVSPQQANADAQGLMSLNLQQSMEKQMPALQKAIEGAGTSASSMQALLANRIAQDAALNASALGGEQQKAYAQSRAQLASLLEAFTRPQNTVENTLIQALNALKGAVTTTNSTRFSNQNSSQNTTGRQNQTTNSQQVAQRGAINPVNETLKQVAAPERYRVYDDGGQVIQYNPVNTAGIDNGISIQNTTNSSGGDGYDIGSIISNNSGTDYSGYSSADAVRQAAYNNIDSAATTDEQYYDYGSVDATDYYAYD
jgi:hypothetical protein